MAPDFDTIHSPLTSIHCRTNTSCTRRSQAASHTITDLAQCCLTSIFKWELVYPTRQRRELGSLLAQWCLTLMFECYINHGMAADQKNHCSKELGCCLRRLGHQTSLDHFLAEIFTNLKELSTFCLDFFSSRLTKENSWDRNFCCQDSEFIQKHEFRNKNQKSLSFPAQGQTFFVNYFPTKLNGTKQNHDDGESPLFSSWAWSYNAGVVLGGAGVAATAAAEDKAEANF